MKRRRPTRNPSPVPHFPAPDPAAPSFEVVRVHEESGRVQLVAWNQAKDDAETIAFTSNADMENGETVAMSGKKERGWVYRARPAGERRG